MRKTVRNCILLLAAGIVTGFLFLLLVFALPKQRMLYHVQESVGTLQADFEHEEVVYGYSGTLKGIFTDSLMLHSAVYEAEGRNVLEQAMGIYRGELSEEYWVPGEAVIRYAIGETLPYEESYARYWHGYLVFLKPLLLCFNLANLRLFGTVLQPLLLGVVLWLFYKRGRMEYGMAYGATVLCMLPVSMQLSLSLSICYLILSAVVIYQLCRHEKLEEKKHYPELFLATGMAAAYFDLLTYPLVTLGIPLCICMVLTKDSLKKRIQRLAGYSLSWAAGYGSMWAAKWILSDVLLGSGVIADALQTLSARTSTAQSYNKLTGLWHVITANCKPYCNWPYLLFGLLILAFAVVRMIQSRKETDWAAFREDSVVFALISLMPFGWFLVTENHSSEHWMFTFKILSVSIFAFLCWTLKTTAAKKAAA